MSPDLRNHGSMEARMLDECWAGCMGCKIPWLSLWSNKVKVGWLELGSFLFWDIDHQSVLPSLKSTHTSPGYYLELRPTEETKSLWQCNRIKSKNRETHSSASGQRRQGSGGLIWVVIPSQEWDKGVNSLVSVTVKLLLELIPAEVKLMASSAWFKMMLLKSGYEKTQQTNREGLAKEYLGGAKWFSFLIISRGEGKGNEIRAIGPLICRFFKKSFFPYNSVMKMCITVWRLQNCICYWVTATGLWADPPAVKTWLGWEDWTQSSHCCF